MLALFIAFWAALDDPRWAVLTVFVVSQPDSGLVVAKSVHRMLGTVAGVLVSIALVFAFAQYGELFLASLAAWIAFCCFAARTARNFASYGFQLAGYTAAIVGLPAALEPSGAYPLIVARFTEISLGIGCAALVSRLFFARELRPKVVALVDDLTRRADHFAALAIDPAADRGASPTSALSSPRTLSRSRQCSSRHFSRAPTLVFATTPGESCGTPRWSFVRLWRGRGAPCWSGAASCDHKSAGIDLPCE